MTSTEPGALTQDQEGIIYRAAVEGIPVGAIARFMKLPYSEINEALHMALAGGLIVGVPRADWPGQEHWDTRARPSLPGKKDDPAELEFACRQQFKLTALEAGFMVCLINKSCAEKDKLHGIVEEKRRERATRPDNTDATDPKMVDVIICKLRQKLRGFGYDVIQTLWGRGYFIEPADKRKLLTTIGLEPPHAGEPVSGRGGVAGASA